jgi:hypothetical protein
MKCGSPAEIHNRNSQLAAFSWCIQASVVSVAPRRDSGIRLMKAFMRSTLVASALAFAFFGASNVRASTLVIDRTAAGGDQWDYVFYSHTGGDLTIDILAADWTSPTTGGLGLEDSYIEFYVNNGSPIGALTGTLIDWNDDSDFATGGDADGSTDELDSFLRLLGLPASNYILAVGNCCSDVPGTDARANTGSKLPAGEDGQLDYRVTFTSTPSVSEVPVPTALPLFVTGLAGLALLARRRKKRAA